GVDEYVVDEEREGTRCRELVAARREPSLESFIPRRGEGLALSASDIDLYRTCPLKYKFARVFAIPEEPTINQRFGILIHQVLERFHTQELREDEDGGGDAGERSGINRLLYLFEVGWRRAGFGSSDDELQYRDRAVAALTRYWERHVGSASSPVWLERRVAVEGGAPHPRRRPHPADRPPRARAELRRHQTGPA